MLGSYTPIMISHIFSAPGRSEFSDVDGTRPEHLVASLQRRSSARLYEPYRSFILESVASTSGAVVDVGAGGGHMLGRLASAFPHRFAVGVEPSAALVEVAASHGRPVVRASSEALPFGSSSVGCVIAERVLQHVYDVPTAISEMLRVLEPGGCIVLADPDHASVLLRVPELQELAGRLVAWRARAGTATPDAAHVSRRLLESEGLHVSQRMFTCATSSYADARVLTNFPEWARLARLGGEDVEEGEMLGWESLWGEVAEGRMSSPEGHWFQWPVVVTVASLA